MPGHIQSLRRMARQGLPTPSPPAPPNSVTYAHVGSPPFIPAEVSPSDQTRADWSHAILAAMGMPQTTENIDSMVCWMTAEGAGGQNNPLNTTLATSGVVGAVNSVGVKNYATPADGVRATAETLAFGSYAPIRAALLSGHGVASTEASVFAITDTWGTADFTNVCGG